MIYDQAHLDYSHGNEFLKRMICSFRKQIQCQNGYFRFMQKIQLYKEH